MSPQPSRLPPPDVRALLVAILATAVGPACEPVPPAPGGPFDHLMAAPQGRFVHVSSVDPTGGNRDRLEIATGDSAVLLDRDGPGVIRRLWITVASRDPHYLRRIALEMYWDGETEPSVLVPLGDFFGNGFDRRHYSALPMGVSSGGFYSYLPMPYARHARIVIRNGTGRPIDAFYYNLDLVEPERLSDELATFHAWWHRDPRTSSPEPHTVLDAVGSGRFAGLSLNAESSDQGLFYLEGDEIFTVDGEPRGQGTGTEDYFNGGWYFDQGAFAAATHGVVVKDDERARIAAYRWHIFDPIPFHDSIRIELEHGHANEVVADYATVAYWYQTEPHARLPALPHADERRIQDVRLPAAAIPAESLALMADPVTPDRRTVTVDAPRPDRYTVRIYPRGGPGAGTASVGVAGGRTLEVSLEAAEPDTRLPPLTLDTVAATGPVELGVTTDGALATGTPLDAVLLEPVRRWAREWMVVGPFPNPRILGTETSPAVDSVYGPETDPALDATFAGSDGSALRWRPARAGGDGRVHLDPLFTPNDAVVAYAGAFLYSPDEREATLLLGADDAHVLWVNGERLSERQGRHISVADELAIPVTLRPGWNRLLLKVADLDGGWAFLLRAADPGAELRWSPRPPGATP